MKRSRATSAQRRATRKATESDYARMVLAAASVVVQNRGMQYRTGDPEYVLFEFPHWVTFNQTFPKGHLVAKTTLTNTYKINAVKLLDWLYNNGHAAYDSGMLVKQTRVFEELDKKIDRVFTE